MTEKLEKLIAALRKVDSELSYLDLADMLWLAEHIRPSQDEPPVELLPTPPSSKPEKKSQPNIPGGPQEARGQGSKPGDKLPATPTESGAQPGVDLNLPGPDTKGQEQRARAFRTPGVSSLPGKLGLARAMRPLQRRVRSRWVAELDEEATARRIAEEKLWLPVLRPARERWLEVALVVDKSPSMVIWGPTVAELERVVSRLGAFRDIRRWTLVTEGELALYRGSGHREEKRRWQELSDPAGRRLIIVVTDCVSAGWRLGQAFEWLARWGQTNPVTILELLPDYLWPATALGQGSPARLHYESENIANYQLKAEQTGYWAENSGYDRQTEFAVPVVSLEAFRLSNWARMLSQPRQARAEGYVLAAKANPKLHIPTKQMAAVEPAEELVARFKTVCSPTTRELAVLLSQVPFNLPVIRLVQHAVQGKPDPQYLAELFFSGMLRRVSEPDENLDPDSIVYDFKPGVREVLQQSLPLSSSRRVWRELTRFVEQEAGPEQLIEFVTYLPDPEGDVLITPQMRVLAGVTAETLRRFGGEFARRAAELEQVYKETGEAISAVREDGQADQVKAVVHEPDFGGVLGRNAPGSFVPGGVGNLSSKPKTILLVDNDLNFLTSVAQFLREKGYFVIEAGSPPDALRCLTETQIDLVVQGIRMENDADTSDTSGLSLAREISEIKPALPKIIFSGVEDTRIIAEILRLQAGGQPLARDFVPKQDGLHALLNAIQKIIGTEVKEELAETVGWQDRLTQVRNLSDVYSRTLAMCNLAEEMVKGGLSEEGQEVAVEALRTINEVKNQSQKVALLKAIGEMEGRVGEQGRAQSAFSDAFGMIRSFEKERETYQSLVALAGSIARVGLTEFSLFVARSIDSDLWEVRALAEAIDGLFEAGITDYAEAMLNEVLALASAIEDVTDRHNALVRTVESMLKIGKYTQAIELVQAVFEEQQRDEALIGIIEKFEEIGANEQAYALAHSISDAQLRENVLQGLKSIKGEVEAPSESDKKSIQEAVSISREEALARLSFNNTTLFDLAADAIFKSVSRERLMETGPALQLKERLGPEFEARLAQLPKVSVGEAQVISIEGLGLPARHLILGAIVEHAGSVLIPTIESVVQAVRSGLAKVEELSDVKTLLVSEIATSWGEVFSTDIAPYVVQAVIEHLQGGSHLQSVIFSFSSWSLKQVYLEAYRQLGGVVEFESSEPTPPLSYEEALARLDFVEGDLLNTSVEAIVHPTSRDLGFRGEIGRQLVEHLSVEERKILQSQTPLEPNEVVVSHLTDLAASYVLHVPLSSTQQTRPNIDEIVGATLATLRKVEDLKLTEIAFPAMGSGAAQIDSTKIAPLLLGSILQYLQKGSRIRKIVFVFRDVLAYQAYLEAYRQLGGAVETEVREEQQAIETRLRSFPNPTANDPSKNEKPAIIIGYSHKDRLWFDRLLPYLVSLEKEAQFIVWDDTRILSDSQWRKEIEISLTQARASILLVSSDFLEFYFSILIQIPALLGKAEEELTILPLFVNTITSEELGPLNRLHFLNFPSNPLNNLIAGEWEALFAELVKNLRHVVTRDAQPIVTSTLTPEPQPVSSLVKTEQERLLHELDDLNTTHERRRDIGDRLSIIGDTRPGVGVRADGTPDIVWLPVAPGGAMVIERQTFSVQPFYIAKYQITYAQYEAFVQATDGFNNPEWWTAMPVEYQRQQLEEQRSKSLNNPRDSVSWYQGMAFTNWLKYRLHGLELVFPEEFFARRLVVGENAEVRLPLEWEWQWAAQGGGQQREYPWGEWQAGYTNTAEAGLDRATAVGMYQQGAAACGALDMNGNVWEWCLNKYSSILDIQVDESNDYRVLRGGSFYSNSSFAGNMYRKSSRPFSDSSDFGLRVVIVPINSASL